MIPQCLNKKEPELQKNKALWKKEPWFFLMSSMQRTKINPLTSKILPTAYHTVHSGITERTKPYDAEKKQTYQFQTGRECSHVFHFSLL